MWNLGNSTRVQSIVYPYLFFWLFLYLCKTCQPPVILFWLLMKLCFFPKKEQKKHVGNLLSNWTLFILLSFLKMSEPKWEDLDRDCLVSIFGRVGLESLLYGVPYVCKKWYKATLIPQSWQHLDFSKLQHHDSWYCDDFASRRMDTYPVKGNFTITAFIKSAVKRSGRFATYIALPELTNRCMEEALLYVADE